MLHDVIQNDLKYPKALRKLRGTVLQCCEETGSHSRSQMPGTWKCWATFKFSPPSGVERRYHELISGMGLRMVILLKSCMRSSCCIWCRKISSEQFFLNLQLNGNKMIHNMSKLLKFLLSSSGPKPQSIIAKLPVESQGSWWSRVIEHSRWGRKLFLKRACGNNSWESWYSNWRLFLLPFLRFKKEKVNLDIKEKTKPKLLCLLLHYKSKI